MEIDTQEAKYSKQKGMELKTIYFMNIGIMYLIFIFSNSIEFFIFY